MKVLSNLLGNGSKIKYTEVVCQKDNTTKNIKEYIDESEVYSTSEVKTNKVWIDGKPIYRKVISFTTTISSNTLFTLAHNISNLSYYRITEAIVKSESGLSYTLPMVGYGTNTTDKLFCYMNGTNIYFYSNGSWGAIWKKYVTIEYTKTTD